MTALRVKAKIRNELRRQMRGEILLALVLLALCQQRLSLLFPLLFLLNKLVVAAWEEGNEKRMCLRRVILQHEREAATANSTSFLNRISVSG